MQPRWKVFWRFLKTLQIELPYDSAISFLGIYLKKTKTLIQKNTCTSFFIISIFLIVKIQKQPKYVSRDECIKIGILLSHKKNEILPFATTWINPENTMLSEIDGERQILYDITYLQNLKNIYIYICSKIKTDSHV